MISFFVIFSTVCCWNGFLCLTNALDDDLLHDLPPMLDSEDISYFTANDDLERLHWALTNVFARSNRNPDPEQIVHPRLPDVIVSKGGGSTYSTAYKLALDIEQAYYLVEQCPEMAVSLRNYYLEKVIPTLEAVLSNVPPLEALSRTGGLYAFREADWAVGVGQVYNKAFYVPEFNFPNPDQILSHEIKRNAAVYEREWREHGVVVIDNLLSQSALALLQKMLWESTVWYQTKMPLKFGGYVGAYIDDGLHQRFLLDLSSQLRKALPNSIIAEHFLKYLWAYKYDSSYNGIHTHADQAAVNVNIWVTPDDANLDPDSGGLVVYTTKPPENWDFVTYNANIERIERDVLAPTNYANITIPYRCNRAVIFDSALFHHTDTFRFKQGYKNRRINLTLLYGEMQINYCKNKGSTAC